jgi:hypothetical protein
MAKDQQRKLPLKKLSNNQVTYNALKAVKGYSPSNDDYSLANMEKRHDNMVAAQSNKAQAEAALKTARDLEVEAEWNFHNALLQCKDLVKGQFGKNSNEAQALGLKKPVDYKKPKSKKSAAAAKNAA